MKEGKVTVERQANMYHNASAFTDLVTSASTYENSTYERMGKVNPVQESLTFRSLSSTLSATQSQPVLQPQLPHDQHIWHPHS